MDTKFALVKKPEELDVLLDKRIRLILREAPCAVLHAGSSWSNGIDCPLTLGMLSFGNMGRVTSMGRKQAVGLY